MVYEKTASIEKKIIDERAPNCFDFHEPNRSGGMSNELNNIISRNTNGVFEGCAIGGDRYPGSNFLDHLQRYHDEPKVQLLVLLGEIGGIEEYEIIQAKKDGKLTKPIVAWCIGTCASLFGSGLTLNITKILTAIKA